MRTAIITGGAGGLGQALAQGLTRQGWQVALIDLPQALARLDPQERTSLHGCDLTDEAAMRAACQEIRARADSIDLVIYNAGVTLIGPFEAQNASAHRRVFEINYFAAVAMAKEMLHDLRRSRGTHLAISSVAGFSPLYHRTAYAASKHALEGFFHSLRSEEEPHGVRVLVAAPSFVATNLDRPERDALGIGRPGAAADGVDYMTPDAAAAIILEGLEKGKPMIPVGRVARVAWMLQRLSPRLMERMMTKRMRKQGG